MRHVVIIVGLRDERKNDFPFHKLAWKTKVRLAIFLINFLEKDLRTFAKGIYNWNPEFIETLSHNSVSALTC